MEKFIKNGTNEIVYAVQWFENGDHPDDNCHLIYPNPKSMTQFAPYLSSGKIVGRYVSEPREAILTCLICGRKMFDHGVVRSSGQVVCPESWIVHEDNGEKHVYDDDSFNALYSPV